jgi:polysaccharide biosynthesis/export protein
MNKILIRFLLVLLIPLLYSCITYKNINYLQNPGMGVAAYKDTVKFDDYKLQSGDRLSANIYSLNPEVARLFQQDGIVTEGGSSNLNLYTYGIDEKGLMHFPYVGDFQAAGKTLRELKFDLESAIKTGLGECYIRLYLANSCFSIIGEGGSGKYNLVKDKTNIFEALAMSGDLGNLADRAKIQIIRQTPKGPDIKTFDIRSKDILHSEFYYVQPNDVIYVQPISSHFFGITSWSSMVGMVTTSISMVILAVSLSKYLK